MASHLEPQPKELADTLHVYGYAWQAEVRALRERIAALEKGLDDAVHLLPPDFRDEFAPLRAERGRK